MMSYFHSSHMSDKNTLAEKKHDNINLVKPPSFITNQNKLITAPMCSCLLSHRNRHRAKSPCYQLTARSWGWELGCGERILMWQFFTVRVSRRDRSVAQTPATLTQCDLRQLGNAQEDTKNLYAVRALPCTQRKLHLAVYTL